jgi:hypothetical protein
MMGMKEAKELAVKIEKLCLQENNNDTTKKDIMTVKRDEHVIAILRDDLMKLIKLLSTSIQ